MLERFFWPTKGTGGLQHHKFLTFDGKQHPKNIWLLTWMLKSPLTSVLKKEKRGFLNRDLSVLKYKKVEFYFIHSELCPFLPSNYYYKQKNGLFHAKKYVHIAIF